MACQTGPGSWDLWHVECHKKSKGTPMKRFPGQPHDMEERLKKIGGTPIERFPGSGAFRGTPIKKFPGRQGPNRASSQFLSGIPYCIQWFVRSWDTTSVQFHKASYIIVFSRTSGPAEIPESRFSRAHEAPYNIAFRDSLSQQ